jgi:hypothetical protein
MMVPAGRNAFAMEPETLHGTSGMVGIAPQSEEPPWAHPDDDFLLELPTGRTPRIQEFAHVMSTAARE